MYIAIPATLLIGMILTLAIQETLQAIQDRKERRLNAQCRDLVDSIFKTVSQKQNFEINPNTCGDIFESCKEVLK